MSLYFLYHLGTEIGWTEYIIHYFFKIIFSVGNLTSSRGSRLNLSEATRPLQVEVGGQARRSRSVGPLEVSASGGRTRREGSAGRKSHRTSENPPKIFLKQRRLLETSVHDYVLTFDKGITNRKEDKWYHNYFGYFLVYFVHPQYSHCFQVLLLAICAFFILNSALSE
jgi:hypothetical protein